MKSFVYQGKTAAGKMIKGEVEAASEVEARVKLRAQRVIPLKVVEKSSLSAPTGSGGDFMSLIGAAPRVKSKELQIFTRQFATLLNSGVPVVQSLDILMGQNASPPLRATLRSVKTSIEGGKRLGESMEAWPKVFNTLYVSLVKAGEEGGVLDTILNRLATYIEKSNALKGKVIGALWYPAAIMAVAALVISGLMIFVIPKFEELFKGAGQELPKFTQVVIDISHFFQHHFFFLLIMGVAFILGIRSYYNTLDGRRAIDTIIIQIPVFGSLIQKSAIARFTRTMSTMLGCGVGIIESLDICAGVVGNYVIEQAMVRCKTSISQGRSLIQPLSQEPYIPGMVSQMIGVGEATGALDTMLGKIADFYEEEVDTAVDALTSLMEPMMMVFLGAIIAVIVVAMYLPIFNLAGAVGK